MEIGESKKATINSELLWNDTGIALLADQKYHFQATGQWTDWKNTCDADGYQRPNFFLKLCEGSTANAPSPLFCSHRLH